MIDGKLDKCVNLPEFLLLDSTELQPWWQLQVQADIILSNDEWWILVFPVRNTDTRV